MRRPARGPGRLALAVCLRLAAAGVWLGCQAKSGAPERAVRSLTPGGGSPSTPLQVAAAALPSAAGPCAELRTLGCTELGTDSGVCELLTSEAGTMPSARCDALLEQRAQTLADFRQLEESHRPVSGASWVSLVEPEAPSLGPEAAAVTVVAFLDFECAECVPSAKLLPLLVTRYPGRVRVVFRQHPRASSARARELAEAGRVAHEQRKFGPYYDCIYNTQHDLEHGALARCARAAGLNIDAVTQAIQGKRFAPAVEHDRALGQQSSVGAVPYFFVNGKRLAGTTDTQALEALVARALAG